MSDTKGASTIQCPKCRREMTRETAADVECDHCPGCGGFWLDALELEAITKAGVGRQIDRAETRTPARAIGALHCPRDKSQLIDMVGLNQAHVKYEGCKLCGGIFLDAGELADLSRLSIGDRLRWILKGA